jgi:ATP-dependent DNA helicase PIF1
MSIIACLVFAIKHSLFYSSLRSFPFLVAPTGIAAQKFRGGMTLASFAGIGIKGDKLNAEELLGWIRKNGRNANKRWLTTQTLIIDEVSMLSAALLDKLDYCARKLRGDADKPFGGMQLVLCGDL